MILFIFSIEVEIAEQSPDASSPVGRELDCIIIIGWTFHHHLPLHVIPYLVKEHSPVAHTFGVKRVLRSQVNPSFGNLVQFSV